MNRRKAKEGRKKEETREKVWGNRGKIIRNIQKSEKKREKIAQTNNNNKLLYSHISKKHIASLTVKHK